MTDTWCQFLTGHALYDTYTSGDITFRFSHGWWQEPRIANDEVVSCE